MNIMLLGYSRAGKGEFCKIAAQKGIHSSSSSKMASDLGAFDKLAKQHGFSDRESFYKHRHIDRAGCYNAIVELNKPDLTYLGRQIFSRYPIYDGCRSIREYNAIKAAGLIDITVWIDAGDRIPPEDESSMTTHKGLADCVIDNSQAGDAGLARYQQAVSSFLSKLSI